MSDSAGYNQAHRLYTALGTCAGCGLVPATERHHRDGRPRNNAPENVAFLCSQCHSALHGKAERLLFYSRLHANPTHCKRGHEFTPENTYTNPKGKRICKRCRALHKRTYRAKLHPPKEEDRP